MDRYSDDRLSAAVDTDVGTGRNESRDSLLLSARFRELGKRREDRVRVRNLSAGGLMIELPRDVAVDTAVEIDVRGIGWVSGRIAWNTAGRAGIAFDAPIDPMLARKPVGASPSPGSNRPIKI
ncbi:PilZ domain-containing protein [Hephaestia sp. GCM10023244]|uniref:PilZ domain-containing protein n=1 Tax=unclassified Hephaestia TaxID=2631281 RepID=UPI0020778F3D|nr:PilZ domain-containing protein [Hephaestia sp. MAHUQ-44]MCM8730141.1 PilZ domain-containing protein [Hephaestia sp. MAHUQ-44]